jgi:hypothetical protein
VSAVEVVRSQVVGQMAKWLASAAGEDAPTPLTYGDATDMLDGLLADGLVSLVCHSDEGSTDA